MTSSPNPSQDEMGVEVHIPPSYLDKWLPGWDDDDVDDTAGAVNHDATSSGSVAGSHMSIKKKCLLAISLVAVSIGGALFALDGSKNTTKAVDVSNLHEVGDALELCEDVRRVLVVPGSEDFQPLRESSNETWQMRFLNRKGSSAQRTKKCVRRGDDDKCAPKAKAKKTSTQADRKLGQQLAKPSSSLTTRSPGPTLCRDDSGSDTLPDKPRVDPVPVTEPPTLSPPRTSAPTNAIVTDATPASTNQPTMATSTPTNQPTKATSTPTNQPSKATSTPTDQPSKATASPTTQPTQTKTTPAPTDQPTKATSSPTDQPTKASANPTTQPTKETSSPTDQPTKATNSPTPKDPNDSNETGFLGYDLVKNDALSLLVNAGLEIKRIAKKKQKVQFSNGENSDITYHEWMDGAGVIPLDDGGYVYVSNSENDDRLGGVWGLYFNKDHEIVGFKKLLGGTTWNCSGGVSPWSTWISCEETETGQCYEIDPDPTSENHETPTQTLLGGDGGQYEAVAVDSRGSEPVFFVTEDKWNGALRRVQSSCSGWGALHGTRDGCTLKTTFLRLFPDQDPPSFQWVTDETEGKRSARNHFPNSEGIAFHDGKLSFVSKTEKIMITLDLDNETYKEERTGLKFRGKGSFNGQPDQTMDDPDSNYMYFTEEDGRGVGLYSRHDKDGYYYTLFEDTGARIGDETVGTATSPDGTKLYVGFQESGELFVLERKDGGRF